MDCKLIAVAVLRSAMMNDFDDLVNKTKAQDFMQKIIVIYSRLNQFKHV